MKNDLLEVAQIGRSVGLKGYLKLHNRSDFIEQFKKGAQFYDKDGFVLTIKHFDKHNLSVLFDGFESVESAKTLTNKTIYATKEQTRNTCKLRDGEYFYFDILGLSVVEDGDILGVVSDIQDNNASHLLLIQTAQNLQELGFSSSFYLPYVDRYVLKIDLQTKQILTKDARLLLESL